MLFSQKEVAKFRKYVHYNLAGSLSKYSFSVTYHKLFVARNLVDPL